MRAVRQAERLAGIKRIAKRERLLEEQSQYATPQSTLIDDSVSHKSDDHDRQFFCSAHIDCKCKQSTPASANGRYATSPLYDETSTSLSPVEHPPPPYFAACNDRQLDQGIFLMTYPLRASFLDPFGTLSSGIELSSDLVDSLLHHCLHVFIPQTFPMEAGNPKQVKSRMGLVQRSAIGARTTFLGYLACTAADRANLQPGNSEAATKANQIYLGVKGLLMQKINEKLNNSNIDDDVFEACAMLLAACNSVGDHKEVRMHMAGIQEMAKVIRSQPDSPMLLRVLTADIKAAVSMLRHPLFPLQWEPRAVDPAILTRMISSLPACIRGRATKFESIDGLSSSLQNILLSLGEICYFCDFNGKDPQGLTDAEHDLFRCKSLEIEYTLLSYAYNEFPAGPGGINDLQIPPLEAIIRIAALCLLNRMSVHSRADSGAGRALLLHLRKASVMCRVSSKMPNVLLDLHIWISLLGVQGSGPQREEKFFMDRLTNLCTIRGWQSYEKLADAMMGFLYVPSMQERGWRQTWVTAITTRNLINYGCM